MITPTVPLLICILGLLLWILASQPKTSNAIASEAGRLSFFAGLLVTLLTVAAARVF